MNKPALSLLDCIANQRKSYQSRRTSLIDSCLLGLLDKDLVTISPRFMFENSESTAGYARQVYRDGERVDSEILKRSCGKTLKLENSVEVVDLGSGDGLRSKPLLQYWKNVRGIQIHYKAVDTSRLLLSENEINLTSIVNTWESFESDIEQDSLPNSQNQRIFLLLGSTYAMWSPLEAQSVISNLSLQQNDILIVGCDLFTDVNGPTLLSRDFSKYYDPGMRLGIFKSLVKNKEDIRHFVMWNNEYNRFEMYCSLLKNPPELTNLGCSDKTMFLVSIARRPFPSDLVSEMENCEILGNVYSYADIHFSYSWFVGQKTLKRGNDEKS